MSKNIKDLYFGKGACLKQKTNPAGRRKRGLGLPIHIKLILTLLNMSFILNYMN